MRDSQSKLLQDDLDDIEDEDEDDEKVSIFNKPNYDLGYHIIITMNLMSIALKQCWPQLSITSIMVWMYIQIFINIGFIIAYLTELY